jgi:tetratricopeptide (TPR) repeat protein
VGSCEFVEGGNWRLFVGAEEGQAMTNRLAVLAFLTALLAVSSGARVEAVTSQELQDACKWATGTPDTTIAACTQILAGLKTDRNRSDELYHSEILFTRALAYSSKGDWDRAIADMTRGIKLNPTSETAFQDRGAAYYAKADYERAIDDFTSAIALVPFHADNFELRAICYLRIGKLDLARADLTKALEWNPKSERIKTTLARLAEAETSPLTQPATTKAAQPPDEAPPAPPPVAPPPPAQHSKVDPEKPAIEAPRPTPQVSAPAAAPAIVTLGKRVALVIGNSAYQNTTPLPNPSNDASDIAAALKRLGFIVIEEENLDKHGMDDAFRRFAREMADADTAMFFYAGHAMEWQGANYLMPIDAKLEDEADVPYEMAKLNDLIADMARVKAVRIAVLDACRDNPLENKLKRSIALTRGGAQTRGLARIEKPEGLVIAYATQTGNVAEDGGGRNSPFTAALLEYIETPGLEVGVLFRRVMGNVKQATNGKQHPELSILLDSEFYFKPGS